MIDITKFHGMTGEPVQVRWLDSMKWSGWKYEHDIEEIKTETLRHTSCGFLVYIDDVRCIIAQSTGKDHMADILSIPVMTITNINKLQTVE